MALLAEVLAKARQTGDALSAIEEALALVAAKNERCYLAELYRLKGEFLLGQANERAFADAEATLKESSNIAESQKARSWLLRSAMSRARLCLGVGSTEEPRELVSSGYSQFTEGFNTRDLVDAKALLEQVKN